jgi:hypothetical protein
MTKDYLGIRWSKSEDDQLNQLVNIHGNSKEAFSKIAHLMGNKRTALNVENRFHLVLEKGLRKGSWSSSEDSIILSNTSSGVFDWNLIASRVQGRTAKQCRERFNNKLDPTLSNKPWTPEEDSQLLFFQAEHGNSWKLIATKLKGRSENDIKNRWNKKKLSNSIPQKTKRVEDDNEIIMFSNSKKLKFDPVTYVSPTTNYIDDSDSEDDNDQLTSFRNKFASFQKTVINGTKPEVSNDRTNDPKVTTYNNTKFERTSNNYSTTTDTSYASSTDASQSNTAYSGTYKDNTFIEDEYIGLISGFSSLTNSGRNSPIDNNNLFSNEYDTSQMNLTSSNSSISLGSLSSLSFINLMNSVGDNIDDA